MEQRKVIYLEIKQRILNGVYKPGVPLIEKEICKEFNVSRTPYREALIKLDSDAFIQTNTNKGVIVSPIDLNLIRDVFEIRNIFETIAIRLAFKRIDSKQLDKLKTLVDKINLLSDKDDFTEYLELDAQFHEIITDAQGNKILKDALLKLRDQCIRLWNIIENTEKITTTMIESIKDISKIHDAFVAKDLTKLEKLIKIHFAVYIQTVIDNLFGDFNYNI